MGTRRGWREEFRHQSRECQELSAAAAGHQLIFKMSSEHQTVDHTNKLTGNDHDTILVRFRSVAPHDTNFVSSAQNANDVAQSSD